MSPRGMHALYISHLILVASIWDSKNFPCFEKMKKNKNKNKKLKLGQVSQSVNIQNTV